MGRKNRVRGWRERSAREKKGRQRSEEGESTEGGEGMIGIHLTPTDIISHIPQRL